MTCLGERSRYTLNQWAAQDERRSRELGFARGRVVLMAITLRTLADSDLDTLFVWESDPRAVQMAAFTRADPSDRTAFDAHHERIRNDPSCTLRAIDDDGAFVGTVGSFTMEGEREVTYWIAPARWGQGLASRALRAFLAIEPTRPLYGRVAHHNAASAKVLARAGFVEVDRETAFAPGVGAEIVELIYRLDH
jgi:RimJ/RimL family protein N-acetyltransferase